MRTALTIAGSDSGGGAGIQADLKTFAAHGLHGLSVVAALTAQHTRGVSAVHVPPVEFLRAQIDACFADFRIGAVKVGMLANACAIKPISFPHLVLDLEIIPNRRKLGFPLSPFAKHALWPIGPFF